jgi:SAM-dependent methyltransferase
VCSCVTYSRVVTSARAYPPTGRSLPLPVFTSVTHLHLLSVINSGIQPQPRRRVRVLDAGCGTGHLLAYLSAALPTLQPGIEWEFYGFDVVDTGVQTDVDFLTATKTLLAQTQPHVDWDVRIAGIRLDDPWPWDDSFFDVVISNQVIEHVDRLDHFLAQLCRVLVRGGFSAHLFPTRAVLLETHVHVALAHRFSSFDSIAWWMKAANSVGFGRFDTYNEPNDTLGRFAEKEADRLWNYTRYRSARQLLASGRSAGLRASWRYTSDFYGAKWRASMRRPPRYRYGRRSGLVEALAPSLLQRASSVTMYLEKQNLAPTTATGNDGI